MTKMTSQSSFAYRWTTTRDELVRRAEDAAKESSRVRARQFQSLAHFLRSQSAHSPAISRVSGRRAGP